MLWRISYQADRLRKHRLLQKARRFLDNLVRDYRNSIFFLVS